MQEDFKVPFKDLLNMEILERIISSFDAEVRRANLDTFLNEEFIEMTFDHEVKSMYTFKEIGYYWMNKETVGKYPKLSVTVEYILLACPSSNMVESIFSYVHYLLSKQRSTLNIECGDLQLKLTNLQPNIHDLLSA